MAEKPTCSCGSTDALPVKRIIFPCAGVANVGQITNCAAIQLTEEGYGGASCVALLATGAEGLMKNIASSDEILILDGCQVQCGRKIAEEQGIAIDQHIVVTELGITKAGSKDYSDEDIETVVSAVWEGKGTTCSKQCGSGCGCGCR